MNSNYLIDQLPKMIEHALDHHQIMYSGMQKQHTTMLLTLDRIIELLEKMPFAKPETIQDMRLSRKILVADWEQENEFIQDGGDYLRKIIALTNELKNQKR